MSLSTGGVQTLVMNAGGLSAGLVHLLLGSASGTQPGIPVGGSLLPLGAPDAYLDFTLANPNSALLPGSLGFLDEEGRAVATFVLPSGASPGLAGLTLNHAFVALDPVAGGAPTFASQAAALALVP